MKYYLVSVLCLSFLCLTGCQEGGLFSASDSAAEIASLEAQIAQAEYTIDQQADQISNLQNISKPVVELLTKVNKISLGRYSRIVDQDNDQLIDEVVVYLQVYDASDDLVKASGTLSVELWDLNAPEHENLVKRWTISAQQLEKSWDGGLLADHYHLVLPVDNYRTSGEQLNLKCRFIETLTGKDWDVQKVVTQQ